MIKNAEYISELIIDPLNLSAKAQVGIDLTIQSIKRINNLTGLAQENPSTPTIYNDSTAAAIGIKNTFIDYTEVPLTEESMVGSFVGETPEPGVTGDSTTQKVFILDPGTYSVTFDQGLKPLPADNTAFIHHRSTLLRNGVMVISGVYDPGFEVPNMGAVLVVLSPIKLEEHARIAQIVIHENETAELYNGSYQGTKDIK